MDIRREHMKKMVKKYKFSKFKCFLNGMIFASISLIALILCMSEITVYCSEPSEVILPFFVAIISMLLGLVSMFYNKDIRKEKTE
jgi:hypothetical protein